MLSVASGRPVSTASRIYVDAADTVWALSRSGRSTTSRIRRLRRRGVDAVEIGARLHRREYVDAVDIYAIDFGIICRQGWQKV